MSSKVDSSGFDPNDPCVLFLAASVLASIGTNMLTSNPSNFLGELMIIIGAFVYLISALMTTIFAPEGVN